MKNELKELCSRLEGYNEADKFLVISADRRDDGTWCLVVTHEKDQEANNESDK